MAQYLHRVIQVPACSLSSGPTFSFNNQIRIIFPVLFRGSPDSVSVRPSSCPSPMKSGEKKKFLLLGYTAQDGSLASCTSHVERWILVFIVKDPSLCFSEPKNQLASRGILPLHLYFRNNYGSLFCDSNLLPDASNIFHSQSTKSEWGRRDWEQKEHASRQTSFSVHTPR